MCRVNYKRGNFDLWCLTKQAKGPHKPYKEKTIIRIHYVYAIKQADGCRISVHNRCQRLYRFMRAPRRAPLLFITEIDRRPSLSCKRYVDKYQVK